MKRLKLALFAVALVVASAHAAPAAEIRSYVVHLVVSSTGSAEGSATIEVAGAAEGRLTVPLGFATAENVRVEEGPSGTTVAVTRGNGQVLVALAWPADAAAERATVTVKLRFAVPEAFEKVTPAAGEKSTLPADNRIVRHALVNSQPATVRGYRLEMVFPEGLRAHAIREALPKLRKTETGARVQLDEIDGQHGARLQVDRLTQGESASMQLELTPERRSPGWAVFGLALSLLYLYYFRDLVSRKAR